MPRTPRSPVISARRINKPPHPSPSPRRRTKNKPSRPAGNNILKRCSSAPLLSSPRRDDSDLDDVGGGGGGSFSMRREGSTIFRPQTFSDAFISSPSHFASSPNIYSSQGSLFASSPKNIYSNNQIKEYDKEAKVVVNVTVEGSSGPVRILVKLGSTVEETIKRVVDKYREEGRSPQIHPNVALSSFQLHCSYFSVQSLDKSELIGDFSSRSFYLQKSSNAFQSESAGELVARDSAPHSATPPLLLPSFIARKFGKIVRRARRLLQISVCEQ